ncbi:hypothetical protein ACFTQ7_03825 [Lysinibacillus sp. NPDC056959]|uniref:hypothetical protein n=1 Tax=Lysinibacillus sp. NPDC056959 TaxID=3345981 RepID=UPI00362D8EB3
MILKVFEEYSSSYNVLHQQVEDVGNGTVIWSNSYLEIYPYQYELNQLPKPKIYKKEPKSKEGIIVNKLKNNRYTSNDNFRAHTCIVNLTNRFV